MATAVMQAATPHASRQQLFLSEKLLSAVDHSSPSGPSPHAVSPVMSPSQIPGPGGPRKGAQRPNVESTPQPSYARSRVDGGAAAAAMGGSPWKESWTDELFSVDITLPRGFDLASITGSGRNKETERVEVDTGTVITVEVLHSPAACCAQPHREWLVRPASALPVADLWVCSLPPQYRDKAASDPLSPGGGPGLSDFSVIICGDDERNVDEARSRIEGYLSAICPADTEVNGMMPRSCQPHHPGIDRMCPQVSVRTSTGGARELKLGDLSAVANDRCDRPLPRTPVHQLVRHAHSSTRPAIYNALGALTETAGCFSAAVVSCSTWSCGYCSRMTTSRPSWRRNCSGRRTNWSAQFARARKLARC